MFTLTPNILKNLISIPATRRYPFEKRHPFENSRGLLENDIVKCVFCGLCAIKCPSQCISVDKKKGVWQCDPFACIFCGVCVDCCPEKSLSQIGEYRPPVHERIVIFRQGAPRVSKSAS